MQVLILYSTRTGNTRKLAEEIGNGVREVEGVACILKGAAEVTMEDFLAADAIVAGSPVYFGTMSAELKSVFDSFVGIRNKMGDKIGSAFATSGDITGGKETTMMSILQAFLIYGMIVVGDPLEATGHYGTACTGAPDERSRENARKQGRRIAELIRRLRK